MTATFLRTRLYLLIALLVSSCGSASSSAATGPPDSSNSSNSSNSARPPKISGKRLAQGHDFAVIRLQAPVRVGEMQLPAETIGTLRSDGWLDSVFLASPIRWRGRKLLAGTFILFDQARPTTLAPPTAAKEKNPLGSYQDLAPSGRTLPRATRFPTTEHEFSMFKLRCYAPEAMRTQGPITDSFVALHSLARTTPAAIEVGHQGNHSIVLLRPLVVKHIEIPAGTIIRLDEDLLELLVVEEIRLGASVLPRGSRLRTERQTVHIYDHATKTSTEKDTVQLEGQLSRTSDFGSLPVAARSPFYLLGDGSPQSIELAESARIGSAELPAGTRLLFTTSGLYMARFKEDVRLANIRAAAGSFGCMWPDGGVQMAQVANETKLSGHHFPAGTFLELDQEGRLRSARLLTNHVVQGYLLKAEGFAEFHPNGRLSFFTPAEPIALDGINCRANSNVLVHANGKLAGCAMSSAKTIKGVPLKGSVKLSESGEPLSGTLAAPITIDGRRFRAGTRYGSTYTDTFDLLLQTRKELNSSLRDLDQEIDKAVVDGLLKLRNKGIVANFSRGNVHFIRQKRRFAKRSFDLKRTYSIVDFLRNDPFDECDSKVELFLRVSWEVRSRQIHDAELIVQARVRKISIDPGLCPVGSIGLSIMAALAEINGGLKLAPLKKIRRRLQGWVSQGEEDLALPPDVISVRGTQVRPVDLFIDSKGLKARYEFTRVLKLGKK